MGVIHVDGRAIGVIGHVLHASGRAFEMGQRRHRRFLAAAAGENQPQGAERVAGLEITDQRQQYLIGVVVEDDRENLAVRPRCLAFEADMGALAAKAHDPAAAPGDDARKVWKFRCIGIDYGDAALLENVLEEPVLGIEIAFHVAVVIEMVTAEIGKGGGTDSHAIETALIKPVAGGLHHQVVHPPQGKRREGFVKSHRVRRGQPHARVQAVGSNSGVQPQSAQARRLAPQALPDLPRKGGDRCLAVGAGDGGDVIGLMGIKPGRHQGEDAARVMGGKNGHVRAALAGHSVLPGQNSQGTTFNGLGDEGAAVGLGAGQGREQVTRPHLAGIGAQAGNVRVRGQGLLGGVCHGPMDQFRKKQGLVPGA